MEFGGWKAANLPASVAEHPLGKITSALRIRPAFRHARAGANVQFLYHWKRSEAWVPELALPQLSTRGQGTQKRYRSLPARAWRAAVHEESAPVVDSRNPQEPLFQPVSGVLSERLCPCYSNAPRERLVFLKARPRTARCRWTRTQRQVRYCSAARARRYFPLNQHGSHNGIRLDRGAEYGNLA